MQNTASARLRIIEASITAARRTGLGNLTVGDAAKAAGVSTALVHYHFDTKQALIVAVAERVAGDDGVAFADALAHGKGLATLDRLWDELRARVASGAARLRADLLLLAASQPELAAAAATGTAAVRNALALRLPTLLAELGAVPGGAAEELAGSIAALLDGLAISLAAGAPAAEVRAAYDAFWLTLLSAGQGGRRR